MKNRCKNVEKRTLGVFSVIAFFTNEHALTKPFVFCNLCFFLEIKEPELNSQKRKHFCEESSLACFFFRWNTSIIRPKHLENLLSFFVSDIFRPNWLKKPFRSISENNQRSNTKSSRARWQLLSPVARSPPLPGNHNKTRLAIIFHRTLRGGVGSSGSWRMCLYRAPLQNKLCYSILGRSPARDAAGASRLSNISHSAVISTARRRDKRTDKQGPDRGAGPVGAARLFPNWTMREFPREVAVASTHKRSRSTATNQIKPRITYIVSPLWRVLSVLARIELRFQVLRE